MRAFENDLGDLGDLGSEHNNSVYYIIFKEYIGFIRDFEDMVFSCLCVLPSPKSPKSPKSFGGSF